MENEKTTTQTEPTKDGVFLPWKDIEEYQAYKRRKKLNEIASAFACSKYSLCEGGELQRVCERAIRLGQPSVRVPLSKLAQTRYYLGASRVKLDCYIGGTGETLGAVKAYEARKALRGKASELSVVVTPSLVNAMRYTDIKRELKRLKRIAGKSCFTVCAGATYTPSALTRLARVASEIGANYFSVPYHTGCERLRLDLTGGCKLEVTGVNELALWKKLRGYGTSRIVTDNAWEMHSEWLRGEEKTEEKPKAEQPAQPAPVKKEETPAKEEEKKYNPETDYQCKLVGNKLQFS